MTLPCTVVAIAALAGTTLGQISAPHLVVATGDLLPTVAGSGSIIDFGASSSGQFGGMLGDGTVAFAAVVDDGGSNRTGYWLAKAGGFQRIAMGTEAAAGVPGATYRDDGFLFAPQVAGNNHVAAQIGTFVPGGPGNVYGTWAGHPAPVGVLGANSLPAVALPGASYYSFALPRVTPSGLVNAVSSVTGPGITTENDTVLWQFSGSSPRLVAREGMPAPSAPAGVVISSLAAMPVADGSGRVAFSGEVAGPGVSSGTNSYSTWKESSSGLEQVYRQRTTPAPGYSDGTVFAHIGPVISSSGSFGIMVNALEGPTITPANNTGVWTWDGAFHEVLREGQPISPTPGARRLGDANVGQDAMYNDAGRMALSASTIDSNNVQRFSMLAGTSAGFSVLFDIGQQAPGLPAGVQIGGAFSGPMNGQGDIAMSLTLQGSGVNSSNNLALYVIGMTGDMHLIARTGDLFEFRPGEFSTITRLPGTFGFMNRASLGDNGQMLFAAGFASGFTGLYTMTIPGPSGVVCLAASLTLLGRRRSRSR